MFADDPFFDSRAMFLWTFY